MRKDSWGKSLWLKALQRKLLIGYWLSDAVLFTVYDPQFWRCNGPRAVNLTLMWHHPRVCLLQWKMRITVTLSNCEKCWSEWTWRTWESRLTHGITSCTVAANWRKWASRIRTLTANPLGLLSSSLETEYYIFFYFKKIQLNIFFSTSVRLFLISDLKVFSLAACRKRTKQRETSSWASCRKKKKKWDKCSYSESKRRRPSWKKQRRRYFRSFVRHKPYGLFLGFLPLTCDSRVTALPAAWKVWPSKEAPPGWEEETGGEEEIPWRRAEHL